MPRHVTIPAAPLLHVMTIWCAAMAPLCAQEDGQRAASPGGITYLIDAAQGDDSNPSGRPWRSFARVNALTLAASDRVEIAPGRYEGTLSLHGAGSAEHPIIIRFKPGIITIGMLGILKLPMFISNSCDSAAPKPIGILIRESSHIRLEGGGAEGPGATTIIYDGRMVELFNDHVDGLSCTDLAFDLKRPTVSEFRTLEVGPAQAVIQVAEGSDYAIENGRFVWTGDWGPGAFCQEGIPAEGRCWRAPTPRGWTAQGQMEAQATDLGGRKVRLDFAKDGSGLAPGHQYHFRNTTRDTVGVHNARCADIVIRDCAFHALTGMGFVSQFTANITYQHVQVVPPANTIRSCPAWGDIFQFSNCRGSILVDGCRLSGMQDDAINCHGTYLRIVEKTADNQVLVRFVNGQTYGFAAFAPGDEVAVMNPGTLREYPGNPHARVAAIERRSDQDWLVSFAGAAPRFEKDDVLDNLTWNPDITVRGNDVDMDPVRGFLFGTRGRVVVEGNTLRRCFMQAILVEGDGQYWMESSPIRDLLIRNNHFIACGIAIDANTKARPAGEAVHENIRITGNIFDQVQGAAVVARAVKGLTVTGNATEKGPGPVPVDADKACSDVHTDSR
jgi:hypothetical protein